MPGFGVRRLAVVILGAAALGSALLVSAPSADLLPPGPAVNMMVSSWRIDLSSGAVTQPQTHYASPSRAVLEASLREAVAGSRFRVVYVKMLHPLQGAPLIVIRSPPGPDPRTNAARAGQMFAAVERIEYLLVPNCKPRLYEGDLVEAVDSGGKPLYVTFDVAGVGGNAWFASTLLEGEALRHDGFIPCSQLDVPICGTDGTGKVSTHAKPCTTQVTGN